MVQEAQCIRSDDSSSADDKVAAGGGGGGNDDNGFTIRSANNPNHINNNSTETSPSTRAITMTQHGAAGSHHRLTTTTNGGGDFRFYTNGGADADDGIVDDDEEEEEEENDGRSNNSNNSAGASGRAAADQPPPRNVIQQQRTHSLVIHHHRPNGAEAATTSTAVVVNDVHHQQQRSNTEIRNEIADRYHQAYVAWVNSQLRKRVAATTATSSSISSTCTTHSANSSPQHVPASTTNTARPLIVQDLSTDMCDGILMSHLIETLSGEKIQQNGGGVGSLITASHKKLESGSSVEQLDQAERENNYKTILQFMANHRIPVKNSHSQPLSSRDLANGDARALMRLIHALASYYKPQSIQRSSSAHSHAVTNGTASSTVAPRAVMPKALDHAPMVPLSGMMNGNHHQHQHSSDSASSSQQQSANNNNHRDNDSCTNGGGDTSPLRKSKSYSSLRFPPHTTMQQYPSQLRQQPAAESRGNDNGIASGENLEKAHDKLRTGSNTRFLNMITGSSNTLRLHNVSQPYRQNNNNGAAQPMMNGNNGVKHVTFLDDTAMISRLRNGGCNVKTSCNNFTGRINEEVAVVKPSTLTITQRLTEDVRKDANRAPLLAFRPASIPGITGGQSLATSAAKPVGALKGIFKRHLNGASHRQNEQLPPSKSDSYCNNARDVAKSKSLERPSTLVPPASLLLNGVGNKPTVSGAGGSGFGDVHSASVAQSTAELDLNNWPNHLQRLKTMIENLKRTINQLSSAVSSNDSTTAHQASNKSLLDTAVADLLQLTEALDECEERVQRGSAELQRLADHCAALDASKNDLLLKIAQMEGAITLSANHDDSKVQHLKKQVAELRALVVQQNDNLRQTRAAHEIMERELKQCQHTLALTSTTANATPLQQHRNFSVSAVLCAKPPLIGPATVLSSIPQLNVPPLPSSSSASNSSSHSSSLSISTSSSTNSATTNGDTLPNTPTTSTKCIYFLESGLPIRCTIAKRSSQITLLDVKRTILKDPALFNLYRFYFEANDADVGKVREEVASNNTHVPFLDGSKIICWLERIALDTHV